MMMTKIEQIGYSDPFTQYKRYSMNGERPSLLMESISKNLAYGKESIVVPNTAVRISGKNDDFCLEALTEAGAAILGQFRKDDFQYANDLHISDGKITGKVKKTDARNLSEEERIRQPNTSYVIRTVLDKFRLLKDEHAGLYGAFAYDFARNFEHFGDRFSSTEDSEPDFLLFMPTNVIYFDDIREKCFVKRFVIDGHCDEMKETAATDHDFQPLPMKTYEDMSIAEYEKKVAEIIKEIKNGRFMQCVLSRNQGMSLQKHPIESYTKLREINPSPYSFYFSFGDGKYLYGASPEMHIKVDEGEIEIRPIAGTIRRSDNPLEDMKRRIELLTDEKEKREHFMLVDLARNEMNRLCDVGSVVETDIGTLEAYPNLYHIVSGVKGIMRQGYDALDALLTTIPAGTLSGAPKLEAMKMIEILENSRRDFYGGAIGYLNFLRGCNTGITIRSVFVKDKMSYVRAGAGIVAHSIPENEAIETKIKSEKALEVLR